MICFNIKNPAMLNTLISNTLLISKSIYGPRELNNPRYLKVCVKFTALLNIAIYQVDG